MLLPADRTNHAPRLWLTGLKETALGRGGAAAPKHTAEKLLRKAPLEQTQVDDQTHGAHGGHSHGSQQSSALGVDKTEEQTADQRAKHADSTVAKGPAQPHPSPKARQQAHGHAGQNKQKNNVHGEFLTVLENAMRPIAARFPKTEEIDAPRGPLFAASLPCFRREAAFRAKAELEEGCNLARR